MGKGEEKRIQIRHEGRKRSKKKEMGHFQTEPRDTVAVHRACRSASLDAAEIPQTFTAQQHKEITNKVRRICQCEIVVVLGRCHVDPFLRASLHMFTSKAHCHGRSVQFPLGLFVHIRARTIFL
jgi:hypothetical protein